MLCVRAVPSPQRDKGKLTFEAVYSYSALTRELQRAQPVVNIGRVDCTVSSQQHRHCSVLQVGGVNVTGQAPLLKCRQVLMRQGRIKARHAVHVYAVLLSPSVALLPL